MYNSDSETRYDVVKIAKAKGQEVVEADPKTLQIDIDTEEDWTRWQEGYEILGNVLDIDSYEVKMSGSGYPHRHITIKLLNKTDVWKRIALQMCFGSHITREILNCKRVLNNSEVTVLFFEKPKGNRTRMIRVEQ